MSQIRTKDTVDAVKELVSELTPIYIIKEAIDNGDGTFTLSTNRTYWLTINKRITIDSIEYRITAFEINVSITIKPITTGDPIPTVTFFTIPAPLFFHGVTLMAVDEQGKNKDPNGRIPFVWLYEILDETVIKDEFDPWGRSSKPQLFFMDESSLENWTSADHKTNVLEPMRQMVELFFEKINDSEGDKYKEILTSSQIARANWGKFITDLGSVKKFFNDDLSGHQVGFDFVMSKTECDTRSENVVACNLTAQVTTIAETGVGENDGIAISTPINGIGPYTYSWSGPSGFSSTLQCIVGLEPGVYTVVITDQGVEQCTDQESGTVVSAGACGLIIDSITFTEPSYYGASDGTAIVNYSGNIGSVLIEWSNGQTSQTATGLTAGRSCVVVVDTGASGCFEMGFVNITNGAALSFSSNAASSTIFGVTYTGINTLTWTDEIDTYTGTSVTFANWNDSTVKNVRLDVDDPENISGFTANTFNNKSITSMNWGGMANISGVINCNNNPNLTTLVDPPVTNTITELQFFDADLLSFNWDNYQQCEYLRLDNNTNLSSITLTGIAASLKYFNYGSGSANIDLSSFSNCTADCDITYTGTGTFTPPTMGTGSIDDVVIMNISNSTLDLSSWTKTSSNAVWRVEGCPSLTTLDLPTTTIGQINPRIRDNPNLTTCDPSGFFDVKGEYQFNLNTSLTSCPFPTVTISSKINLTMGNNLLGYSDITVMSGLFGFNNVIIHLLNNSMSTIEVNHYLVDILSMVSGESPGGDYTGRAVSINGTNAAPDGSSGGYDGDQAVIDLVALGFTITTS